MQHTLDDAEVLNDAAQAFADTIALKVQQLRKYIPKANAATNTAVTGAYIEELVRGFVRGWIGHRELLHGTLYSPPHAQRGEKSPQLDGIVYDPKLGPPIIREGDFAILHPLLCDGIIEIKTTCKSIKRLERRLWDIHWRYQSPLGRIGTSKVMGIVISDPDPEKVSVCRRRGKAPLNFYDFESQALRRELLVGKRDPRTAAAFDSFDTTLCPIFVLFKEDNGELTPHDAAIRAMIRAIYKLICV